MSDSSFFNKRNLLVATKHQKEKVIAPLLFSEFEINCLVNPNIDTDSLGTFTGEIERSDDVLTTLRKKCELGCQFEDADLILASEGSFGPHPHLFFAPVNEEMILLKDIKNDLEFFAKILSSETNFSAQSIDSWEELIQFSNQIGFPEHGIILRKSREEKVQLIKGITTWEELEDGFHAVKCKNGSVYAETDMRAMFNPTRMKVIEQCTQKLIDLMHSKCPECQTPGFQIVNATSGLPCFSCGLPTQSIKSHFYACKICDHRREKLYPDGKTHEEPTFCDFCNP